MRRAIALALSTVCLLAGAAAAATGSRTVSRTYEPVVVSPSFPQGGVQSSSTMTLRTRAHEHYVTVAIQDDSGLTVPGEIRQDLDGDDEADTTYEFCGSTPAPVEIEPGVRVTIAMLTGSCGDETDPSSYGVWTTGTVTATFSTSVAKASAAKEAPHH